MCFAGLNKKAENLIVKSVLINAANLHVGGGVQVAASFISELAGLRDKIKSIRLFIYASSEVDANLAASGFDRGSFENYFVFDVYGLGALKSSVGKRFVGFDAVFTVFGPLYLFRSIPNHIVGFAQSWIIYPNNEAINDLSVVGRVLLRFKFLVQWLFFRLADRLVVELPHVKNGLANVKSYPGDRIDVVPNCVSAIYFSKPLWAPMKQLSGLDADVVNIGIVSRDYPHKNINFLLDVSRELKFLGKKRYQFFVTLTQEEWSVRSEEFRNSLVNVGPLSVAECPTFYQAMDGVIFPSLLESFSATPLEAMVMKRPLFASDRGFVRDCCGDHAIYFDPLKPSQAAKLIDRWYCELSRSERDERINLAHAHVVNLPGSRHRALAYLDIIHKEF